MRVSFNNELCGWSANVNVMQLLITVDVLPINNEAPLVRGLAADGTISVSRDGWTILNKYTGFITYIGI